MNLKTRIIALVAATAIAVPVVALGKYTVKKGDDSKKSSVTVSGSLVGAGIEATTRDVTISDNDQDLQINVGLGAMKTGIDMRDTHFKQAMRHLGANLVVKSSDVKGKLGAKGGDIPGKLTLNGVTKDVKVHFDVKDDSGGVLHVEGSILGGINRNDFKVGKKDAPPEEKDPEKRKKEAERDRFCNMGVCVKDNLTVKADIYVNKG